MAQPVLDVSELSVSYGKVCALQPLSFDVMPSGLCVVLGPNGAGKTTLVRAIAGAIAAGGGRVTLEGNDVTSAPPINE